MAPRQLPPPAVEASGLAAQSDRQFRARAARGRRAEAFAAGRSLHARAARVSLDLIGLPPTPEEADAFVYDSSPDAYERLVDRLLASPHYGERGRAAGWTWPATPTPTATRRTGRARSGRIAIGSFRRINADMPFDQFTIEQLAGDMLPGATLAQRIATGFHRNTMRNEEGGIDPLEFRFYAMTDRVATTSTVWLGLTLGCASATRTNSIRSPTASITSSSRCSTTPTSRRCAIPRADLAARRGRESKSKSPRWKPNLPDRFPAERRTLASARPGERDS